MSPFQPARRSCIGTLLTTFGAATAMPFGALAAPVAAAAEFDVRAYGARGDGATIDSPAINAAIAAAAQAGGGTVRFPAGNYLSYSIRLRSNIALVLDAGCTIVAAEPGEGAQNQYDPFEPNPWDAYQDFGHSHFHNSLIWGEGLENVTIAGPGRIWGRGLTRSGPGANRPLKAGDIPSSLGDSDPMGERKRSAVFGSEMAGKGNKAIALKNCRNVQLRDFSMLKCGHFAVLATGVDNLAIENLSVDTERDGFDIDCCRHVRIANCAVNTQNDDAICLKSSYALGAPRFTEHVTITGCQVSGFDLGTFLDGTYGTKTKEAPDKEGVCGRIKLGTESNGGFRNIAITNCTFVHCRGLAIESVDGAIIEDITVDNLTMRDLTTSPLFIRLGARMRAPEGAKPGAIRRVNISNVVVSGAHAPFASIVAGMVDAPVEDVRISNFTIVHDGGGTAADAERNPPEHADHYPEPSMFGVTPSYGLYARHVRNLEVHHGELRLAGSEARPAVALHDVESARFDHVRFARGEAKQVFQLRDVRDFSVKEAQGMRDTVRARVPRGGL